MLQLGQAALQTRPGSHSLELEQSDSQLGDQQLELLLLVLPLSPEPQPKHPTAIIITRSARTHRMRVPLSRRR